MSSFAELKRSRDNSLKTLMDEVNKVTNPQQQNSGGADERIWKPDVDKAGNGYAVIRFLPAPEGEDLPWVRVFDHGFQGPGGWYIENSLTTLNKKDPVSEYNSMLWNSGIESNKDIVRKQKRRLNYYANIIVIKDPTRPENEGKVFLYKFGKKIFDKINDAMNPPFEGDDPVNPFDLWEGADFRLKIRNVAGYRNYDASEFDRPSALNDDDAELERIWKSQYSLSEFTDPANFKSYDELQAKLNRVLGLDGGSPTSRSTAEEIEIEDSAPAPQQKTAAAPSFDTSQDDDDDDSMSFFEKLAAD